MQQTACAAKLYRLKLISICGKWSLVRSHNRNEMS